MSCVEPVRRVTFGSTGWVKALPSQMERTLVDRVEADGAGGCAGHRGALRCLQVQAEAAPRTTRPVRDPTIPGSRHAQGAVPQGPRPGGGRHYPSGSGRFGVEKRTQYGTALRL